MPDSERKNLFNFITKEKRFNKEEEDCQWFYARFNPDNQFMVELLNSDKVEPIPCFLKDDKYYISIDKWVEPSYIKSITKIKL